MTDVSRQRLLLVGLLAGFALCAMTNASLAATPTTSWKARLDTALLRGDAGTVFRIAKQNHLAPFWFGFYRDELEYRLPELLARAKECRNSMYARRSRTLDAKAATDCERVILTTSYQLGDARGYFEALGWRQSHGNSLLSRTYSGTKPPPQDPKLDIAKLAASIPAYSVQAGSMATVVLPYVVRERRQRSASSTTGTIVGASGRVNSHEPTRPEVAITINGHRAIAQVDSGTHNVLVMSASKAKTLGLQSLASGFRGIQFVTEPPVPAARVVLALVRRLKLGSLEMDNVLAIVMPNRYSLGGSKMLIVGLPALAHFRNVEFKRSSLVLNAPDARCPESAPATYAYTAMQDGQAGPGLLVFAAKAGSRSVEAAVDTGSNLPLIAGIRLAPNAQGMMGVAMGSSPDSTDGKRDRSYLAVHAAGVSLSDDYALVIPSLAFPDVLIGAPVLAGANVRLTFQPKLSVCFTHRSPTNAKTDPPAGFTQQKLRNGTPSARTLSDDMVSQVLWKPDHDLILATQTPSPPFVPAFRIPLLQSADLFQGRTLAMRYAHPPPPWIHVHLHCLIYQGNAYIRGTFTGNFGRPLPGLTEYVGHGDSANGAFVSNGSGRFGGTIPLSAGPIATPPGVVKTPLQCTRARVRVGHASP